jgi:hypothetical protein
MGQKKNLILAAAISAILASHGAAPAKPCITEKLICPEPEIPPVDMPEHGRPSGPSFSPNKTTGPTGPGPRNITGTGTLNATASIVEGRDGASGNGNTTIVPGTGAMNFASAGPQVDQDIQPRIIPPTA